MHPWLMPRGVLHELHVFSFGFQMMDRKQILPGITTTLFNLQTSASNMYVVCLSAAFILLSWWLCVLASAVCTVLSLQDKHSCGNAASTSGHLGNDMYVAVLFLFMVLPLLYFWFPVQSPPCLICTTTLVLEDQLVFVSAELVNICPLSLNCCLLQSHSLIPHVTAIYLSSRPPILGSHLTIQLASILNCFVTH